MNTRDPIIQILLGEGLLEAQPSVSIFAGSSEGPIRAMARAGLIDEKSALKAVAAKLGIDYLDLSDPKNSVSLNVSRFLPKLDEELCWNRKLLPFCEQAGKVLCACVDPLDHQSVKALEFSLSKPIKLVLVEEQKLNRLLLEHCPPSKEDFAGISRIAESTNKEAEDFSNADQIIKSDDVSSPPIIRIVNKILAGAVGRESSDIHLEPMQHSLTVRLRIDGKMEHFLELPKKLQAPVSARIKLLSGMDIAEKRRPQDGRFRINISGETVDLRVSSVTTAFGESLVLRLLRNRKDSLTFKDLNLPGDLAQAITRILTSEGKMFLVTGPTGSGKTTSLYACLTFLLNGTTNIVTVEDPIEYRIQGVNQIQVNEDIDLTFPAALRSILRQDPDVIMLGEIRDADTAEITVQAAQTGHKVLSTLHTNDAPGALIRLRDLGVTSSSIADALGGVLAQRLVRRLCVHCASPDCSNPDILKIATQLGIEKSVLRFPTGCSECEGKGYKGRVAVYSLLEIDQSCRQLILKDASIPEIIGAAQSYKTLHQAAIELVCSGETCLTEALPLLELNSFDQNNSTTTVASAPSSSSLRKRTVLLVEDNEELSSVLSMLLSREMFEVIVAPNGQAALEKLHEGELPDLVLCDLMMPVMDGKEFLTRFRSLKETDHIPILVLTAADSEQNEISLLELGATDFISKTASSSVMVARIRRALS